MPQRQPLTQLEYAKIVINLLETNEDKNNRKKDVGRSRHTIPVTETDVCYLCTETRCLEKAHIIPVALYEHSESDGTKLPDYTRHVMYLCPTHHKCFDKFKLNKNEKKIIVASLNSYKHGIADILKHTIILKTDDKAVKDIDRLIMTAWYWWRNYIYGN